MGLEKTFLPCIIYWSRGNAPGNPCHSFDKEKTMAQSLADLLASARQMAAGLTTNAAAVAARGLTAAFTTSGQTKISLVQTLETEQETLKAALKLKTAALDAAVADLKNWESEAASTVKLAYRTQPEKWGEFGIKAKR
jgi:phosphate-selective porin